MAEKGWFETEESRLSSTRLSAKESAVAAPFGSVRSAFKSSMIFVRCRRSRFKICVLLCNDFTQWTQDGR